MLNRKWLRYVVDIVVHLVKDIETPHEINMVTDTVGMVTEIGETIPGNATGDVVTVEVVVATDIEIMNTVELIRITISGMGDRMIELDMIVQVVGPIERKGEDILGKRVDHPVWDVEVALII